MKNKITDNIYIKTLKLGVDNSDGISFNEIIDKLNINISDDSFKLNFTIWFYSNFHNQNIERYVVGLNFPNSDSRISSKTIDEISNHYDEKCFIRGDAVNKYIDYLELERTRKSSKNAVIIASFSFLIAIASIIIPIKFPQYPSPPYDVIITNDRNQTTEEELDNTTKFKFREEDMGKEQTDSNSVLNTKNPI